MSVLGITLNNLLLFKLCWNFGRRGVLLLLPSLPGLFWPGVVAPDRFLSMGKIELNCVLMLNWIIWNRTVFDIEIVLWLNCIVWNSTVFIFNWVETKIILTLKRIIWIRTVWLNWIAWNKNVFDNDIVYLN